MRTVLTTLLSHWRRNPLQLAAMVIGLALATALWSGVQAINAEARASYARAASLLGGDAVPTLLPATGDTLPQQVFATLRRAGVEVSPVLEGRLVIGDARYRIIGVEPVSMPPAAQPARVVEGEPLDFLQPPHQIIASPRTVDALADADLPPRFPPRLADPDLAPGLMITDIGVAQRLLDRPGRISSLLLHPDATIDDAMLADNGLRRGEDRDAALAGLTDSFHLNLTAFGFLAFVVGLFIVHSAIGLATEQRLAMFRTLRACGVSARALTLTLLVEVLGIALLSGLVGVVLGYFVAGGLLPNVAGSLSGLYGVSVSNSLTLSADWWLGSLAMSLVGALAAVSLALVTAYRMPPLASAQPEAWRQAQQKRLRWCGFGAAATGGVAALLYLTGSTLEAGFATMGLALLAAALVLPVLLDRLLTFGAGAARSAMAEWIWADMRQQLSGLTLALMALLLALSANIGVGTMVEGFRTTFLGWLDQRLAAELYVRGADPVEHRALEDWLAGRAEVRAILPSRRGADMLATHPVEILGVVDHPTYREEWPLIDRTDGAWTALFAGSGAMLNEQAAFRLDLAPGDTVTLRGDPLTIVATYPDYGNPQGQILVTLDWLERLYPEADRLGTGLRLDPADTDRLMTALGASFELAPDQVIDQTNLKRVATEVFEKTFSVTSALNVLTLAVAGVALFTSMLTLADRRLPQVAPLWAIGTTRRDLARAEMGKTLGLALLTSLAAVPLGLLLAHLLVAVINVQAFGWRLPLHAFPGQWALLVALSVAIAGLAAAIPVMRLNRIAPARLLKVFADAR